MIGPIEMGWTELVPPMADNNATKAWYLTVASTSSFLLLK